MTDFFNDFHFMRPLWLLALFAPLFFYAKYFKGAKNKSAWERVCDKNLLEFLVVKGSAKARKTVSILVCLAFITAILALSAPAWKKKEVPLAEPENPLMLVLNLSSEMKEKDVSPDRLSRAKFKIRDLLNSLSAVQVGMIVYSEEPFLISPITSDTKVIENLLPAIDFDIMPVDGDRLDRAITFAVDRLKASGFNHGNIVVLTPDVLQKFDASLKSLDKSFAVNVIAVSKEKNEKLEMVANNSGGIYATISVSDSDIEKIADKINAEHSNALKVSENMRLTFEDFGYYLCFIPLALSLLFFRKGILIVAFLISLTDPCEARFLLNKNQWGMKEFNQEDFAGAAKSFEDSQWKGAALYRINDFEKAYEEFSKENNATAKYNQGNALAKAGKIEEAIKKYEEVLEIEPENEDAKFNLEYLKNQQKQQQQNNQQAPSSGENQAQQESQDQNQDQKEEDFSEKKQNQDEQKNQQQDSESEQEQSQQQNKRKDQSQEQKSSEAEALKAQAKQQEEKFNETAQAVEMKYREIPEDPGGLLRAFIEREYTQKRYER